MKLRDGIILVMAGVGATLLYQQYANGNLDNVIKKMCKAKKEVIEDLEDMM